MAGNLSLTREYQRIFSIAKDQVEPIIFDNASARTPTLFRYKDMGAIIRTGGRPHLRFNILKELPTTAAYTDLDVITPSRGDPVTSVVYEWKQLQCPVQMSGLDLIKTGEGSEVNLLELFLQSAEISLRDGLGGSALGIFSDAGESDLTKVTGLQNALTTTPTTGTVGQLSRASQTNWRHQTQNALNDFSANGLNSFRTLYRQCARHDENVDTIALNGSTYDNLLRDLTSTFQVNMPMMGFGPGNARLIDAGFQNVSYNGAAVFPDDGVPADRGYFLNVAKYVRLYVREGRDVEMGDFVKSRDRDDLVTFLFWAGNQVFLNLARIGLIYNTDTY